MRIQTVKDIVDLKGKTVLLRVDYNVPLNGAGEIEDDSRIVGSLRTVNYLLEREARVVVISHLGRPKGEVVEKLRLDPVAKRLSELLGKEVKKLNEVMSDEVESAVRGMQNGEVVMLENIRFRKEEKACDLGFAEELSGYGDVFVSDAFATAHRKHCSTWALSHYLPSYGGFLMEREMEALSPTVEGDIKSPVVMIVGGAKIATKIGVLNNFMSKADYFIIGGGLANTFLKAKGVEVGSSLYEEEQVALAQEIMKKLGDKILLPVDVIVSKEVSAEAKGNLKSLGEIEADDKILDVGEKSMAIFAAVLEEAKTVVWNGPVGLYEFSEFAGGSFELARMVAASEAYSVVGGGDTADCIKKSGADLSSFTHISTGGGACIDFLAGESLPGIEILRADQNSV